MSAMQLALKQQPKTVQSTKRTNRILMWVIFNAAGIGQTLGHIGIVDKLTNFMNIVPNKRTTTGAIA